MSTYSLAQKEPTRKPNMWPIRIIVWRQAAKHKTYIQKSIFWPHIVKIAALFAIHPSSKESSDFPPSGKIMDDGMRHLPEERARFLRSEIGLTDEEG